MSDLSSFLSTRNKVWNAQLWDGLIEAIGARLAPLEEQLGIQREVAEAIIARGLTVIEQELAPIVQQADQILADTTQEVTNKIERFEHKVTGGTVISYSTTSASLSDGATINLTVAQEDREFFIPTPYLALSRASTVANWAVAKVNSFNRVTGALALSLEQVTGAGGPFSDWVITSLPGATLYQKHLLEQAIQIDGSVQLRQEDVADMSAAVSAWNENVNTKHAQAVAAADAADKDALYVKQTAHKVQLDAEAVKTDLAATKAHREAADGSASTASQQATAAAQSKAASDDNALLSGQNKDAAVAAKQAVEIALGETVDAKKAALIARDEASDKRDESENFRNEAKEFRNEAEEFRNEADSLAASLNPSQFMKKIDVGLVSGFRNKIINGNFDIWQRGVSQNTGGYKSDDRWSISLSGTYVGHSQEKFANGQTDVPGNPVFYSRSVISSVSGTQNHANKWQAIEGVETLAGRTATLTFYAKASASRNLTVEFSHVFGTGGSPSARVNFGVRKVNLTTAWQRFDIVVEVPSISGKTIGTNGDGHLAVTFWFDAGSGFNGRTSSLGHQSGTFDIARVSLVEGDATDEADPFSPRHIQQELALCQRYYRTLSDVWGTSLAFNGFKRAALTFSPAMRALPTVSYDAEPNDGGTVTNHFVQFQSVNGVTLAADLSTTEHFVRFSNIKLDAEL